LFAFSLDKVLKKCYTFYPKEKKGAFYEIKRIG
jgi:hypothetical protein